MDEVARWSVSATQCAASQTLQELGKTDLVRAGELAQRTHAWVEIAALDLLIVGKREVVTSNHVELREAALVPEQAAAATELVKKLFVRFHRKAG
jgi:hypothetical protein